MSQYRKKPVVIDAVQYDGVNDPPGVFRRVEDYSPYVVTIHGQRCYIEQYDWIVPEPDGVHFYPVKPGIFATTYEPVEATPSRSTLSPTERERLAQLMDQQVAVLACCGSRNTDAEARDYRAIASYLRLPAGEQEAPKSCPSQGCEKPAGHDGHHSGWLADTFVAPKGDSA